MVSWRIILQDLSDLLENRFLSDKPLSFQVWCSLLQKHQTQNFSSNQRLVLPFKVGPSNLNYWNMEERENTYHDVICETFAVDEKYAALALGESNNSLRTEPVELFLSAIAHSFSRVFVDRDVPAMYNESHGRESWDTSVDISRTVGCELYFFSLLALFVTSRFLNGVSTKFI